MAKPLAPRLFRVLFVCTGNSARSQIAEALLARKGAGRFAVGSAGSAPAARVNPFAIEVLREAGIAWEGKSPRGIDAAINDEWDFVITVCDKARESCPIFPRAPIQAHWGIPDPAEVEGSDEVKRRAFRETFTVLNRRVDLLLALPIEKLERLEATRRVQALGA